MITSSAAGTFGSRPLRDERGFTLIELIVVVLIINILLAIAIPTYLGAVRESQDRAAQSDLRAALVTARTLAVGNSGGLYQSGGSDIDPAMLTAAEPSITYAVIASASSTVVGVRVEAGGGRVTFETLGDSGSWFALSSDSNGEITFCSSAVAADCDDGATDVFVASGW